MKKSNYRQLSQSSPASNVMVVTALVVKPTILPLYHWEWNQVHHASSSIQSLITYLRYTHAISYERLSGILSSVFGLQISEGAIANLLSTVKTSLDDRVNQILQRLRQAKLICSDETSARVNGQNQWE